MEEDNLEKATTINMDMISTIPDSLLCYILSFLPTRDSVATSILSRRWRHLWKELQVLDLDDGPFCTPERSAEEMDECFIAFINAALSRFPHIKKFRLSCEVLCEDDFRSYINDVTGPYLQELFVSQMYSLENYGVPCGIFTCPSLVSLCLKGYIFIEDEDLQSVHLPSLKNLELDVKYVNADKILGCCPVLETLKLTLDRVEFPTIRMPISTLKRLTFQDDYHGEVVEHLEIETPSLEYLHVSLWGRYLRFSVTDFSNMVEAHLDIWSHQEDEHIGWIPELLKAVCKTKLLRLGSSITGSLLCAPPIDFPKFGCLLHLQLRFGSFKSRFLLDLLHCCHKLQVLIIQNELHGHGPPLNQKSMLQPTSVPNCVTSHLNTFEFGGYEDSLEEHAFVAYILQNGLVLVRMMIHTYTSYVLENLKLAVHRGFPVEDIDKPFIHMPHSLKSLTFKENHCHPALLRFNDIEHLEIDTPFLEYLNINLCTS
ncbi:F-box/LRR-repeat protein [Arachis hypogaea]|nr:F-box/LRR-repeat protein [Arachis hypogaea]